MGRKKTFREKVSNKFNPQVGSVSAGGTFGYHKLTKQDKSNEAAVKEAMARMGTNLDAILATQDASVPTPSTSIAFGHMKAFADSGVTINPASAAEKELNDGLGREEMMQTAVALSMGDAQSGKFGKLSAAASDFLKDSKYEEFRSMIQNWGREAARSDPDFALQQANLVAKAAEDGARLPWTASTATTAQLILDERLYKGMRGMEGGITREEYDAKCGVLRDQMASDGIQQSDFQAEYMGRVAEMAEISPDFRKKYSGMTMGAIQVGRDANGNPYLQRSSGELLTTTDAITVREPQTVEEISAQHYANMSAALKMEGPNTYAGVTSTLSGKNGRGVGRFFEDAAIGLLEDDIGALPKDVSEATARRTGFTADMIHRDGPKGTLTPETVVRGVSNMAANDYSVEHAIAAPKGKRRPEMLGSTNANYDMHNMIKTAASELPPTLYASNAAIPVMQPGSMNMGTQLPQSSPDVLSQQSIDMDSGFSHSGAQEMAAGVADMMQSPAAQQIRQQNPNMTDDEIRREMEHQKLMQDLMSHESTPTSAVQSYKSVPVYSQSMAQNMTPTMGMSQPVSAVQGSNAFDSQAYQMSAPPAYAMPPVQANPHAQTLREFIQAHPEAQTELDEMLAKYQQQQHDALPQAVSEVVQEKIEAEPLPTPEEVIAAKADKEAAVDAITPDDLSSVKPDGPFNGDVHLTNDGEMKIVNSNVSKALSAAYAEARTVEGVERLTPFAEKLRMMTDTENKASNKTMRAFVAELAAMGEENPAVLGDFKSSKELSNFLTRDKGRMLNTDGIRARFQEYQERLKTGGQMDMVSTVYDDMSKRHLQEETLAEVDANMHKDAYAAGSIAGTMFSENAPLRDILARDAAGDERTPESNAVDAQAAIGAAWIFYRARGGAMFDDSERAADFIKGLREGDSVIIARTISDEYAAMSPEARLDMEKRHAELTNQGEYVPPKYEVSGVEQDLDMHYHYPVKYSESLPSPDTLAQSAREAVQQQIGEDMSYNDADMGARLSAINKNEIGSIAADAQRYAIASAKPVPPVTPSYTASVMSSMAAAGDVKNLNMADFDGIRTAMGDSMPDDVKAAFDKLVRVEGYSASEQIEGQTDTNAEPVEKIARDSDEFRNMVQTISSGYLSLSDDVRREHDIRAVETFERMQEDAQFSASDTKPVRQVYMLEEAKALGLPENEEYSRNILHYDSGTVESESTRKYIRNEAAAGLSLEYGEEPSQFRQDAVYTAMQQCTSPIITPSYLAAHRDELGGQDVRDLMMSMTPKQMGEELAAFRTTKKERFSAVLESGPTRDKVFAAYDALSSDERKAIDDKFMQKREEQLCAGAKKKSSARFNKAEELGAPVIESQSEMSIDTDFNASDYV